MKKLKLGILVLTFALIMFMFGGTVNALTEYEESLIYKIAPDGENAVFKMKKPNDIGDFVIITENVLNEMFKSEDYSAWASPTNDELTACEITIWNDNTPKACANSEGTITDGSNIITNYDIVKVIAEIESRVANLTHAIRYGEFCCTATDSKGV